VQARACAGMKLLTPGAPSASERRQSINRHALMKAWRFLGKTRRFSVVPRRGFFVPGRGNDSERAKEDGNRVHQVRRVLAISFLRGRARRSRDVGTLRENRKAL